MQTALRCDTLCPRSSPTFQRESVPNIKYWKSVNKRREVCVFPPMPRNRRTGRELARALCDMRELWIKGNAWDEVQPGDDPVVQEMIGMWSKPLPRLVAAHISWEGIYNYKRYVVPKFTLDRYDSSSGFYRVRVKHLPGNKTGTTTQVVSATQFKAGMSSGHGLNVNDVVDITWYNGSRNGVKVTSVVGNTVTFDEGKGFAPPQNTPIVVITNPSEGGLFTYYWTHRKYPNEWGIGRVLGRMKCLTNVRNWSPKDGKVFARKAKENQGKDQWPGAWYKTTSDFSPILTAAARTPALRLNRFTNMNSGAGISAIMHREPITGDGDNPGFPLTGRYMNYIPSTTLTRSWRSTGLTWAGIEYGIVNPDLVFDSDGDFWIPSPGNAVTDYPKIELDWREDYRNGSTTAPIPVNWMREALTSESILQPGTGYTSTPYNDFPMGYLTTRTNDNSGTITSSLTHKITGTGTGNLHWLYGDESGSRTGVSVSVSSPRNLLIISGGTGDPLPPKDTFVRLYNVTTDTLVYPESLSGYTSIPDRSVYHVDANSNPTFNWPVYNSGVGSYTDFYFALPGLEVPVDPEEGSDRGMLSVAAQTGTGWQGTISQFINIPLWADRTFLETVIAPAFEGQNSSTVQLAYYTDETAWVTAQYMYNHFGEIPNHNFARTAAGIGAGIEQATFTSGWENVCSAFEILNINLFTDKAGLYDWIQRDASIGASGSGIRDVGFTHSVFAKYGAKIMAWRGRSGAFHTRRYGPTVFQAGTKTYQEWDSVMFPGGLTLSGPATLVNHVLPTYDDIIETADVEIDSFAQDYTILEWSDTAFTDTVRTLHPEAVPANYVGNGIAGIVIGSIFGVQAFYNEYYTLFVSHDFSLDA